MVKTLRISDDIHKDVLKIQGSLQMNSGEYTSMDDTIGELIDCYNKNCKRKKN